MTDHDHDARQARAEGASSAEVREAQRRLRDAEVAEREAEAERRLVDLAFRRLLGCVYIAYPVRVVVG